MKLGLESWCRQSPRDELDAVVNALGPDEVRVLTRIGERLRRGRQVYGDLNVAKDEREFRTEAREELEDFLVYAACQWLTREVTG